MPNIEQIANRWESDQIKYSELGDVVNDFLKIQFSNVGILPEISHRTKTLVSIVKKVKKKVSSGKDYTYDDLKDKLGIRVICNYNSDLNLVDNIIKDCFKVIDAEYKQENLDFNKLGYISNHYDLSLDSNHFIEAKHLSDLIFELQVRTLNQHAWSNIAHELSYKQENAIPDKFQRRVYRLLSLYEIADDEFEAVNNALLKNPDSKIYSFLKKLEPYIYKFARIDYDRDMSIFNFRIILSFFTDEEVNSILLSIHDFIHEHENKIRDIFNENQIRYYEIPLLTQPEVFLIWYANLKHSFTLSDNWKIHFDVFDLEQILTLWGSQTE